MAGWRKRIGRMGNHYANEAGLNHTVPMIICWEEPRLLGSLVCSTAGTLFCVSSITHSSLFFFPFPHSAISLAESVPSLLFNSCSCVHVALDLGSQGWILPVNAGRRAYIQNGG